MFLTHLKSQILTEIKTNHLIYIVPRWHGSRIYRSSHPEVFLRQGVLKICIKFTGEHPCGSVISINMLCNLFKIALRHGCSPVNLQHIFRTSFLRNNSGWLPLNLCWLSASLEHDTGGKILLVTFLAQQKIEHNAQR